MSFLNALVTNPVRAEELRHAWKTLSYDIITQPLPASPPPTPKVIDFQSANPSGNVRHLSSDYFFERPQCEARMDPCNNRSCSCQTHCIGDVAKYQNNLLNLYQKQLPYEYVSESSNEPLVRKRKFVSDTKLCHTKRKRTNIEEIACQVHGILSLPGCREPRYVFVPFFNLPGCREPRYVFLHFLEFELALDVLKTLILSNSMKTLLMDFNEQDC